MKPAAHIEIIRNTDERFYWFFLDPVEGIPTAVSNIGFAAPAEAFNDATTILRQTVWQLPFLYQEHIETPTFMEGCFFLVLQKQRQHESYLFKGYRSGLDNTTACLFIAVRPYLSIEQARSAGARVRVDPNTPLKARGGG